MAPLLPLAVLTSLAWVLGGGVPGLTYLCLIGFWILPGIPIGCWLFGARHGAAWIAGAALGYPLTALFFWAAAALGVPTPAGFAGAWLIGTTAIWLATRRGPRPGVALPAWTPRATWALCLVLLLVPALLGRPFARIGETDADGARRFRAYFTADFVWHMSLTAELEKFSRPPRNPYLADEPLRYYWLHFVPVAAAAAVPAAVPDRIGRLTINALGTGTVVVASLFLFVWVGTGGRAAPAAVATALAIVASSAEGAYVLAEHVAAGIPLDAIREINVDAVTSWYFRALTVDGLQRTLMYNPHHAMSSGAGLVALTILAATGARPSAGVAIAAGLALGLALVISPFAGALLAAIFGVATIAGALVQRDEARVRLRSAALAGIPLAVAFGWCVLNRAFEGAGGEVAFGLYPRALTAPVLGLALAVGPVLVPAALGLIWFRDRWRRLLPALVGLVLSIAVMFLVHLRSVDIWTGWRAGHILLVTAPPLAAVALIELSRASRALAVALAIAWAVAGAPTAVLDVVNAQDIGNRRDGPGFAWTVVVTPAEQQALEWLRLHAADDAVVQMEPTSRGRETWTLVPALAARRMAAGLPISLLDRPEYHARSARVRDLYCATNAESAWAIARELGIDFLYLDRVERQAYPGAVAMFESRRDLFLRAFANDEARVYFVQ